MNSIWSHRRLRFAVAATATILVGAVLASAALAGLGALSLGPAAASQYPKKVTVCHRTHSKKHPWVKISISTHALKAHLRHGDTMGACPATAPAQQSKPQQGKGHGKGKGHDQSGSDDAQGAAQSGQAGTTHGKSGEHGKGHDK